MKPHRKHTKREIVIKYFPDAKANSLNGISKILVDNDVIGVGKSNKEAWSNAYNQYINI